MIGTLNRKLVVWGGSMSLLIGVRRHKDRRREAEQELFDGDHDHERD